MSLFDAFRYDGKRALVVGGATGMGAAVAEVVPDAGAEVVVMDRAEVKLAGVKAIHLDLADKASIEAAVDECGGPVHALFSCAGVADGTPGIEKINFLGHRHMIDRMLAADMLAPGLGHRLHLLGRRLRLGAEPRGAQRVPRHPRLRRRRRSGREDNGRADYMLQQARHQRLRRPRGAAAAASRASGSTPSSRARPTRRSPRRTPSSGSASASDYREEAGIEASTPLEQAYPLVFLCSDAAAGVTGITMITDAGYFTAGISGSFPPATPARRVPAHASSCRALRTCGRSPS